MRTFKKSLALVMVLALVLGSFASAVSFSDVPETHQYVEEIELLADLGVLVGDDTGKFNPEKTISRVEAAAIIFRSLTGTTNATMYAGPTKFWDVAEDYWGNGYINYCVEIGAIKGYPDDSFQPDNPITVAEIETMLVSALGLIEGKNLSYPRGYIALADANGINDGVSNLRAEDPAPRALVAKVTYNTIVNAIYATIATKENDKPHIIKEIFKIEPFNAYVLGVNEYTLAQGTVINDVPLAPAHNLVAPGAGKINYAVTDADGKGLTIKPVITTNKADISLLGKNVKVYLRTTGVDKDKPFAIVSSNKNATLTLNNNQIYSTSDTLGVNGNDRYYYFDADGNKTYFTMTNANQAYLNYKPAAVFNDRTVAADAFATAYVAATDLNTAGKAGADVLRTITLVSNDGNNNGYELAFALEYSAEQYDGTSGSKMYFKAISDTSSAAISAYSPLATKDGNKNIDIIQPAGLATGDKVLVNRIYDGTDLVRAEIIAMDSLSGELTQITGNNAFTIGGTSYKFGGYYTATAATVNSFYTKTVYAGGDLNKTFDILVAPGFNLLVSTTETSASIPNYFYVTGASSVAKKNTLEKEILLLEGYNTAGEKKQYYVKDVDWAGTPSDVANYPAIYGAAGDTKTLFEKTSQVIGGVTYAWTANPVYKVMVITVNSSGDITKAEFPKTTAYTSATNYMNKDSYNATSGMISTIGKVNQNSVFFIDEGSKAGANDQQDGNPIAKNVKVYIGTVPAIGTGAQVRLFENQSYYTTNSSGVNEVKVGVIIGKVRGSTSVNSNVIAAQIGNPSRSSDADGHWLTITVLRAGDNDKTTISTEKTEKADIDALHTKLTSGNGSIIYFDLNAAGEIIIASEATDSVKLIGPAADPDIKGGRVTVAAPGTTVAAAGLVGGTDDNKVVWGGVVVNEANAIALGQYGWDANGTSNITSKAAYEGYFSVASDAKVYKLNKASPGSCELSALSAIHVSDLAANKLAYLVIDTDSASKIQEKNVIAIYYFD